MARYPQLQPQPTFHQLPSIYLPIPSLMATNQFHSNSKRSSSPGLGKYQQLRREKRSSLPINAQELPGQLRKRQSPPIVVQQPPNFQTTPIGSQFLTPRPLTATNMPRPKIFQNPVSHWPREKYSKDRASIGCRKQKRNKIP